MFSLAEIQKQIMELNSDSRKRIAAMIQLDPLFNAFEVEMNPLEAHAFAEACPLAGLGAMELAQLIEKINNEIPPVNFGPDHPQTGKRHHAFRIGRERGLRLLKLEIFKGYFNIEYDFLSLMQRIYSMGVSAGATVLVSSDNNSYSLVMHWGQSESRQ